MSHLIEAAKSGRASCRKCKEKIAKGELRFGHAVDSSFSDEPTYQWYHLKCAAEKVPIHLAEALPAYDGDIPDKAEIEKLIAKNRKKQKPSKFPYAERAATGRASCIVCGDKLDKGELRVAVEREVDAGGFARKGAGYMHPRCVSKYEDLPEDLTDQIRKNSLGLDDAELDAVEQEIG